MGLLITLQADFLSTETSDFLKQIIFLTSFNSVLKGVPDRYKLRTNMTMEAYLFDERR